jgi:hypothetical protein
VGDKMKIIDQRFPQCATRIPPASCQGIRGYISVMATWKFTYYYKRNDVCKKKNNYGTSLICGVFISYDR